MIKICHISTVHSVFDDRIFYKECVSLAQHGYDVSLVVQHDKNEKANDVNISALPKYKGRLTRITILPLIALIKALKTKSKIYHFHDPELIFIGFTLKLFGKKVIYDMHELVYYQIIDKKWLGNVLLRKIISKVYFFVEKAAVICFDKIILAEDGYKKYVINHYKKNELKFEFIRNFSILSLIEKVPMIEKKTTNKVVIYAGGLTVIRGIKEVVQAVNRLDGVELWLLGGWESEKYMNECLAEDYKKVVNYIGYVKMEKVYSYMKVADIGIANLYPLENYLTSLPVKAFEYMACKLPIIMSDFPFWKQIFHNNALFVNPKSSKDIADKIEYLLNNQDISEKISNGSYRVVYENYSWEKEAEKLIKLYKDLIK